MISRQYTERTARTSSGTKRPTIRRGIKKRGILPSFGDIILPVVSIAAVGLLILAGRQFFINGMKTPPGISSTRAYAEAPALIAERERAAEAQAELMTRTAQTQDKDSQAPNGDEIDASDTNLLALADIQETSKPDTQAVTQANTQSQSENQAQDVKLTPVKAPEVKTKPQAQSQTQTKNQNQSPVKQANITEAPVKRPAGSNLPPIKQWRVQIGAYTSKSGAQEAANKIKKAGYKAVVYSNPASKHTKVWVLGGTDKKSAERISNAMKSMGYKGSFVFPPAK